MCTCLASLCLGGPTTRERTLYASVLPMTNTPNASVMLASDYPHKGQAAVISVHPRLALGTTAGEGDSQNPKLSPNEDSVAVVALADGGYAMAVADAHFGPTAGESAVRAFVKALAGAKVSSPA